MTLRTVVRRLAPVVVVLLSACTGEQEGLPTPTVTDPSAEATSTSSTSSTTSTTSTTTTTTTTLPYVTEGVKVVVVNASGVDGGAGKLSGELAAVGFTMLEATNAGLNIGLIDTTRIYVAPGDDDAFAAGASLLPALGLTGGTLYELGLPAPTRNGETGGATVMILMGTDIGGKSLLDLQYGGSD